ncbi:site-specific integrase [Sporomusa sphaeroides DSM 2875]|uniref:tyrosine-type recombinase/integrase n=1 Tax=Sporomusa sphaeroides TaxID=47679 RepID=UPI00202E3BCE|nr:tyrosine-type recombinase/integrase [Sporomusa sphaeroides]MCM0760301.1 site-specific integrase [Sporomusa sphaeroides DSM 2875]
MAVIKKGNKFYVVIEMGVDPKTKKRKQKWLSGYDTEDEAKTEERNIGTDRERGVWVEPSKLTFAGFLRNQWLPTRKLAGSTKETYEHFISRLEKHSIGQLKLQKVQALHMETYMAYLFSLGLSSTSVRHEMSLIKGALNWAVNKDLLVKSPARTLVLPERSKFKPYFLEADELQHMINLATKNDQPIEMPIRLAGTCGHRNAETAGLRWQNVYFDKQEIYIEVAYDYIKEGENKGKLGFVDLKTDNSDRIVPVPQDTMDALEKLKELQEAVLKEKGWTNPHNLVNIQLANGRPYSPDYIDRRFAKFLTNHDLPYMRFHDLRHSFAVILRDSGVSMETISELLGHYDASFSHKTYAHPSSKTHHDAMKAFQKTMNKKKPAKAKKTAVTASNTSNKLLTNPI